MLQTFSRAVQVQNQKSLRRRIPETLSHHIFSQRRLLTTVRVLPKSLLAKNETHHFGILQLSTICSSNTVAAMNHDRSEMKHQYENHEMTDSMNHYKKRHKAKKWHKRKKGKRKAQRHPHPTPEKDNSSQEEMVVDTEWIKVSHIPPLSKLEDLLIDVERIMQTELKMGIIDLEKYEQDLLHQEGGIENSTALLLWEPDDHLPSHLVIEAHLILSPLFRSQGWYLRLPNRSCAHALLNHLKEAKQTANMKVNPSETSQEEEDKMQMDKFIARPLKCGWKEVTVKSSQPDEAFLESTKELKISDNVLRVENCCNSLTEAHIASLFSLFVLENGPMSIQQVVKGNDDESTTSSFLVRFETCSEARAALSEKQNSIMLGQPIRLIQYPSSFVESHF